MKADSALERYWQKRDFSQTAEPSGRTVKGARRGARALSFVIQEHHARRLHYDFRLELDGVLKSWAVPKGPSRDPAIKRLAVEVEDHPLDYGKFEGEIPKGQYGAGSVRIWDAGTWTPEGDAHDGLARGRLHFRLDGAHLRGDWMLIRTGKGEQWLLRKLDDAHVVEGDDAADHEPGGAPAAGKLGAARSATRAAGAAGKLAGKIARKAEQAHDGNDVTADAPALAAKPPRRAMPDMIDPQLAVLVDSPPADDGWIYEVKYDGYRMMCRVDGAKVNFLSRTRKDWTARMGPLAKAIGKLRLGRGFLDGEVVVFDETGKSNFQLLQNALDNASAEPRFVVFDLPFWEGRDLRGLPLAERQAALGEVLKDLPPDSPITLTDRLLVEEPAQGEAAVTEACRLGLEGLIAKRVDAPYESTRSRSWVKLKCRPRQEFVVGGYTSPNGSRTGFGALLVGVRGEDGGLHYAGRIGTGYDARTLDTLHARLRALEADKSPFDAQLPAAQRRFAGGVKRSIHWVRPELVVEAEFAGWTSDDLLRQASFVGIREDKPATAVSREEPIRRAAASRSEPAATARSPAGTPRKRSTPGGDNVVAGVRITHPDRRIFGNPVIDKLELARYYDAVGEHLLPHLLGRRLAFLRCPQGTAGDCFFQKHITQTLPEGLKRDGEHILVAEPRGVVHLAQRGVIELHTWGSRLPRADRPDRITMDLDPGPDIDWPTLVEACQLTATLLRELGLEPFIKTTGGKGMHIVAPIRRTLDWDTTKAFTKALAGHLTTLMPDRFTDNMAKNRRDGRIFVDYLRNGENATAIAAFAVRAREGGPVSMPISWDELDEKVDLRGPAFNVRNVPQLLASRDDPWAGYDAATRTVTKTMLKQMRVDAAAVKPSRRKRS